MTYSDMQKLCLQIVSQPRDFVSDHPRVSFLGIKMYARSIITRDRILGCPFSRGNTTAQTSPEKEDVTSYDGYGLRNIQAELKSCQIAFESVDARVDFIRFLATVFETPGCLSE